MRPYTIVGVALATLLVFPLSAQQRVTLILKTGDKAVGTLIALKEQQLRLGQGSGERTLPLDEVSIIEFVASTATLPWNRVAGRHVLMLRDGTEIVGRLRAIEGTPLRIAFDADTGPRLHRIADVARLLIAAPRPAAGADPNCAGPFVGQWTVNNSELGSIGFDAAGGCQLSGWYDAGGGGTLRGTVTGQTVRFHWKAANGSQQGEAVGTLRNPKRFTGKFCVNLGCDTNAGTDFNAIRQKAVDSSSCAQFCPPSRSRSGAFSIPWS